MNVSPDYNRLDPAQKAAVIFAHAHDDVATRLWRAALGGNDSRNDDFGDDLGTTWLADNADFSFDSLLALIMPKAESPLVAPGALAQTGPVDATVMSPTPTPLESLTRPAGFAQSAAGDLMTGLGPNARFGQTLLAASSRTGVPAAALAAIVDAEAGKAIDGSWMTTSRNPRSSAAGLGQFLGGTWQSEAERAGTWLHETATNLGWIGGDGRVLAQAKSALLALRYDATASINATADYAARSVTQLKKAGIAVGEDLATVARAAYLGHHLGTADAVRFLNGGLDNGRARLLLDAQIGSAAANQRIARSGDAATAHRSWLLDFIDRHVTPARFAD